MSDWLGAGRISSEILKAIQRIGAGALQPWQIRRVGKANTDVEIDRTLRLSEAKQHIKSISNEKAPLVALSDRDRELLERAMVGKFNELMREQLNKETILERSIEIGKSSKGKSKPIDEDWLHRFTKYAGEISDKDVQEIWAKILVSEASASLPHVSFKSIDTLRFFDSHLCELFRIVCLSHASFGFVFHDFIEHFLQLGDIEYRREMRILESFGVVNHYELSQSIDLFQRFEFLYYSDKGELGVSRPSTNIDTPVYLLSPIGINLGSAIFGTKFYGETPREADVKYLERLSSLVSVEDRAVSLWRFIHDNMIARYGDTIAVSASGMTGYFSINSFSSDSHLPTFKFEFQNRRQLGQMRKLAPEFYYVYERISKDPQWSGSEAI
jgi:hypothetical protein